jgi:hypothetical protein
MKAIMKAIFKRVGIKG